ncbi:MAG: SEL1-like repeat protein [Bacteroidales bacterium]|nr:SEL1-like repeat protein [Bacteroidales bacterium]
MKSNKILCLFIAIASIPVIASAQNDERALLNMARKGDLEAMYELGFSCLKKGGENNEKSAYYWFLRSAEKEYAPAEAMVTYLSRNGIGTSKDLYNAWQWGQKAAGAGDGLAAWVLAQVCSDRNFDQTVIFDYVGRSFERDYPFAKLLYAKNYAEGNPSLGITQDEKKSVQLLKDLHEFGLPEASALLGSRFIQNPSQAFDYLRVAADAGIPQSLALIGGMYYHGEGVGKNEVEAFKFFGKVAEKNDPVGIEALADCYRTGAGTGVFQERAFNLYSKLEGTSSKVDYILGCYFNEGISTAKDTRKALELFEKAASRGDVYSQAALGIAYYDGVSPVETKDFDKAYSYLKTTLLNKDLGKLPEDMAAKVYEKAARCARFGRGGAVKSKEESDKLQEKADALAELAQSKSVPFASVGLLSFDEIVNRCSLSWSSEEYANILDKVTFDYPKDYLEKGLEAIPEVAPTPVVEEIPAQVAPVAPVPESQPKPAVEKPAKAKSGRLAFVLEAVPYGFGPTSVVSSRDGNTYWLKGTVMEFSATLGWMGNSGFFIGGGAAYDSYSGGRMSVVQGFVDARYFVSAAKKGSFLLGGRAGVGFGSPEFGFGMSASGMMGYRISLGGNTALCLGLKAGLNTFSGSNNSMGTIVAPVLGISL